jgi:hypothetical protein
MDPHPALPVSQVTDIVREWVDLSARSLPGFAGAYLWGGITALPADAPFHLYRDVDVVVVLSSGAPDEEQEVDYRGLILEVIWKNLEDHRDAQAILANPSDGPNMAATQILADPTGILTPLQQAVAADYKRRRWIQARCEAEKVAAAQALAAMHQAAEAEARLNATRAFLGAISGLLAVAQLRRPTTRRTLALLREILEEQGRSDLHEAALILMGCARMSRADVEAMLDHTMVAFDRAVDVYQTTIPYGFAIRAHIRPYYYEGTLEMINQQNHREAVYWISCLDTAYLILHNDAPEAEKPLFASRFQAMYAALGYTSSAHEWAQRVAVAEHLAQQIYQIPDSLLSLHPD